MYIQEKILSVTRNEIGRFERELIKKSTKILSKKRISRTEERIVADTIQLITFTHGLNYYADSDRSD